MIYLKNIVIFITLVFIFVSCSSAQRLQTKSPISYDSIYFQKWISGIKDGGSGLNLFVPVSGRIPDNIILDSVYFRGKGVRLEKIEGEQILYVGRFDTSFNQKPSIVMSIDPIEEYGNQAPILEQKIPFDLNNSECVISYKTGNETKYFKVDSVSEKQSAYYPSAPKRQED